MISWTVTYGPAARNIKVVKLLLKHAVDVDCCDSHGKSALMYAAESGRDEIVERFKSCKANPQNKDGQSMLSPQETQSEVS